MRPGHDVKLSTKLRTYSELTMQFQLPSNLQTELLAYDPKLKQLQREQNPTSNKAKPKFPLGAVFDLIPADVVTPTKLEEVVTDLNARGVEHRHTRFTKAVDVATATARTITYAIIYHYEKVWHAAWLPPRGQGDDYVYGYAYAYKNLDSVRKTVPHTLIDNNSKVTVEYIKYGRSEFCVVRHKVTKEEIANGRTAHWWNPSYISYGKGVQIKTTISAFESTLSETIPKWDDSRGFFDRIVTNNDDSRGFFDRIVTNNWAAILGIKDRSKYWNTFDNPEQAKRDTVPSADLFYALADVYKKNNDYHTQTYCIADRIMHIIGKPFFRKWVQSECDEAIAMFNDVDNNLFRKITQPWSRIQKLVEAIDYINKIWPDCPVDFYQTHIEYLIGTRLDHCVGDSVQLWLRNHMQPATFFHILKKHYEDQVNINSSSLSYYTSSETGKKSFYFTEWNDTLSMLDDVLTNHGSLEAPRRWRLTEFHDHVQAEAWKIKHPNASLPQDLFPSPVKVEVGDESWSFFQPHDTHQLSAWGQAVRNCVGNASEYATGVRKKKHFIVLCMVDSKPKFTVQLTVEMGMMSVNQIVGTSNQRLTQEQKDSYTEAFGKALKLQADALKSA